ncbi:hypothetical protein C3486_08565, partial [Streptomyces sp. Ru73]|uniref:ADP-ribosyltransferase n=1 Tax=Streptomyces sp. Ru73 TaxID=2080748 RepID=UPI000CDDA43C
AGHLRTTGADVHSHFQGLSAFYKAPEAEKLFATTKPVKDRADEFADGLETVASALSAYADEIRPLVPKLAALKTRAQNFIRDHKDDEDGDYDEDLIHEHNQIRDDITATVAAFWAAERTCHNKITALWHGTQMVAGDGSDKQNQYGFNAADMKNAKLPWGDPVEEKHHWYEVGHWVKSFVWDGLIVDGIWGTIKGLGTLVGFGGWDAMGQAWKGLAQLATGLAISSIPGVGTAFWALPDDKMPSWLRDSRTAMKETGKALVAWDEWGKNPGRAAGAVTFNVLTTVFTGGAGGAAAGAGKAGAVAKALSVAGKAGKVIDPMTYVAKGAGAGLSKVGDIAKSIKGIGKVDLPTMPDGSLHLPDGQLPGTHGMPGVPHQTVPGTGLPQSWTIDQPATAGAHAGNGFPGVTHANDAVPMGGHSQTPVNYGGHTPGGSYEPPANGSYGPPSNGSYGPPSGHDFGPNGNSFGPHSNSFGPTGGTYGPHGGSFGPHGTSFDQTPAGHTNPTGGQHVPTGGQHVPTGGSSHVPGGGQHVPSGGSHVPTGGQHVPTGGQHIPSGGSHVPGAGGHAGNPSAWYHEGAPTTPVHDVPTTTPHGPGHDVPAGHPHTPDTPHGPGHDAPGPHGHDGAHGHDGSHGGHGDDAAGHGDDASHAGDHTDLGHDAAHHGSDAPGTPGHGEPDVPGHGADEPFEYKPHMSADDFDNLPTAADKHAVAMEELARGTNRAPSVDNDAGLKYGNDYWNDFLDQLPDESREALKTYSGNEYDLINSHLRFGNPLSDSLKHTIEEMDKVMGARPVPEDVMIVRGTGVDHIKIDGKPLKSPLQMEGGVFDDKAFTSTALGKTPPPPFNLKPVHMHLRVPKGTPALWIDHLSKHPGERELLLAKGSEYKVTRVFMDETDGKWHVYGEVLPRP